MAVFTNLTSLRMAVRSRSTFTWWIGKSSASRGSRNSDGIETLSCTLILTPSNDLMATIHNEKSAMPAVLREEDHDAWLTGSPPAAAAVVQQLYPSDLMVAWQVSRRLYANKTPDDASLIEPVPNSASQLAK
jgi:putative SOS response-associated peptidase YedK